MQNILVTGASGFIASHVIQELTKNENNYIIGIDNIKNYYDINIKYKNNINCMSQNYKFIISDILNEDAISKLFRKYNFDIVLHFAAQPGVSYSIEHPTDVMNINVIGFDIICRLSAKYKVKHFIFASSSSIYGDDGIQKSPYAISKKTNELQAQMYSQLYVNTKFTGLRLFTVYGNNMRPDLAIYKFIDAMYKNKDIHIFGDGYQTRDFTYIDDVVSAITHILESDKHWNCEMFDIGRGESKSVNELLNILKQKINPHYNKIIYENKKPYDAINTCANPTKMKEWFNFMPKYSLYDGINTYIDSCWNNQTIRKK